MSRRDSEKRRVRRLKAHAWGPSLALVAWAFWLNGCSAHTVLAPSANAEHVVPGSEADKKPRHLFVFFDGTNNDDRSATNVWRMFQMVSTNGSPTTRTFYIQGVGANTRNPLTGMLLGVGMEPRIRKAYKFLAENYREVEDDRIYIFGFSRGAHQARHLAGLLSYAGLPVLSSKKIDAFDFNRLIDSVKRESDCRHADAWSSWEPGKGPLLKEAIEEPGDVKVQEAKVAFLGVWDTVPGSFFKHFDKCREREDRKPGDRYKSGSYPSIAVIAQAVANDEKRSRFKPLLLCPPINPEHTKVHEVWFPGAHSDVGGGYDDAIGFGVGPPLSTISLNWMKDLLSESYKFEIPVPDFPENSKALAHWSVGDFPANLFGHCVDRTPLSEHGVPHPSIKERDNADCVPLRVNGEPREVPYPLLCEGRKLLSKE